MRRKKTSWGSNMDSEFWTQPMQLIRATRRCGTRLWKLDTRQAAVNGARANHQPNAMGLYIYMHNYTCTYTHVFTCVYIYIYVYIHRNPHAQYIYIRKGVPPTTVMIYTYCLDDCQVHLNFSSFGEAAATFQRYTARYPSQGVKVSACHNLDLTRRAI